MTKSGYTGMSLAKNRPEAKIYMFTNDKAVLNSLNLVWGLKVFYYDEQKGIEDTFEDLVSILKEKGLLQTGDTYVTTAATPLHWQSKTNMMKVDVVK